MKCVDFQNEFEERNVLGDKATLHLEDCKNCQNFSYQQNRVWEMLGGLGQVEAPKDFNFGVKARIADAGSGDFRTQTSFFPALRYIMPLGFVIVLLSFVALSGLYFVGTQETPISSEQKPLTTPAKTEDLPKIDLAAANKVDEKQSVEMVENTSPEKEVVNEQKIVFNEGNSKVLVAENNNKKPKISNKTIIEDKEDIRSKDSAGTLSPTIIQPEFDSNKKVDVPVNPDTEKTTDIKEVLELSGIGTDSEKGRLKVTSIRKNSIAESSGVMVGDVIDAINGKKISEATFNEKTINIETITVIRKNETKVIAFKAKK